MNSAPDSTHPIPSTLIESPTWDPVFYFIFTVIVPIYFVGVLVNGLVMAAMVSKRTALLAHRIDRIIFLLLGVLCAYSLFASVAQFIVRLFVATTAYSSFLGWMGSLSVLFLFMVNLALAMERRVTIMYPNDAAAAQKTQRHYSVLGAILLLYAAGVTWIYATSPSKNGLSPVYPLQKKIWVSLVASSLGPVILLTCWLYAATYSYAHKTLAKTSYSQVQVLQRRVLISCIIMSSTLAVLYTPEVVFQVTNVVFELDDYNFHFWSRMTVFIMSWDVLVTPGLVLYFRRDIRITLVEMLKKMVEVNRSDGSGDNGNPKMDFEIATINSDEITVEAIDDDSKPRQQSGFHVITVRS